MKKAQLEEILKKKIELKNWWEKMHYASAWVDDGKGGHIPPWPKVLKYEAQIELLNDLISQSTL